MHQRSTQGLHKRNASSHPWFKSHVRRLQDAELEVTQQPSQNEEKQVGSSVRQPVEVSFFLNGCQDAKKPCPDRGVFSLRRACTWEMLHERFQVATHRAENIWGDFPKVFLVMAMYLCYTWDILYLVHFFCWCQAWVILRNPEHRGPCPFHPIQLTHPNGCPLVGFLQEEGQVFNLCLHGWTWGIRNVFLKDAGFQYLKTNQDGSTPATGNHTVDWQILKANDEAIIRALSSIAACAPLALTVDAPHFRQKFTACHPDPCLGVIVLYFFRLVTIGHHYNLFKTSPTPGRNTSLSSSRSCPPNASQIQNNAAAITSYSLRAVFHLTALLTLTIFTPFLSQLGS